MNQTVFRIFLLILTITNLSISQSNDGATYLPFEKPGSAFDFIRSNYDSAGQETEFSRIRALKGAILGTEGILKYFDPNIDQAEYHANIPETIQQTGWMCVAHSLRHALLSGLNPRIKGLELPSAENLYYYLRYLQQHYLGDTPVHTINNQTLKSMKMALRGRSGPCEPCKGRRIEDYKKLVSGDDVGIFVDLILFALKINGIPVTLNGKYAKIFTQHYLWVQNSLFFYFDQNQSANYAYFPLIASNLASTENTSNVVNKDFLDLILSKNIPTVATLNTASTLKSDNYHLYTGGPVGHAVSMVGYKNAVLTIADSMNLSSSSKKTIRVPADNFLRKVVGLFFIFGVNLQHDGQTNLIKFVEYDVNVKTDKINDIMEKLDSFNKGYPVAPK